MKTQNKQELEEAIAEAELHATLSHENVIRYREVFRSGSRTVFIGMHASFQPQGALWPHK